MLLSATIAHFPVIFYGENIKPGIFQFYSENLFTKTCVWVTGLKTVSKLIYLPPTALPAPVSTSIRAFVFRLSFQCPDEIVLEHGCSGE